MTECTCIYKGGRSQSEVGLRLPEDPLGVKVGGGEQLGPAHDGVDLLRQVLGLLLQLLMLLYRSYGCVILYMCVLV